MLQFQEFTESIEQLPSTVQKTNGSPIKIIKIEGGLIKYQHRKKMVNGREDWKVEQMSLQKLYDLYCNVETLKREIVKNYFEEKNKNVPAMAFLRAAKLYDEKGNRCK